MHLLRCNLAKKSTLVMVALAPVVIAVQDHVRTTVLVFVVVVVQDNVSVVKELVQDNVLEQESIDGKNQRKPILMARWYGEEYYLHCHEGLPVGLQILLPRGEEREGTNALGGGEDLH